VGWAGDSLCWANFPVKKEGRNLAIMGRSMIGFKIFQLFLQNILENKSIFSQKKNMTIFEKKKFLYFLME